jgi:plasmid stabilization system protein ParE
MIVIWSEKAENTLKETAEYIFERFGEKNMKNFLQEVFKTAKLLETSPYIGQIEPLLIDFSETYRSIVVNYLNKIIYRVDDSRILIVALWDVRREPMNNVYSI